MAHPQPASKLTPIFLHTLPTAVPAADARPATTVVAGLLEGVQKRSAKESVCFSQIIEIPYHHPHEHGSIYQLKKNSVFVFKLIASEFYIFQEKLLVLMFNIACFFFILSHPSLLKVIK